VTTPTFGRLTDPPATVLLIGARLIDSGAGTDAVRDLGIVDGVLTTAGAVPPGAERIEARGWVVAPGFCDLHTHLRQPGGEEAETVASGARAAAHGGFTTVCAMPNTEPPLDTPARVSAVLDAATDAAARVWVIAAATARRAGMTSSDVTALLDVGAIGVSDDGASVADPDVVRELLHALGPDHPLIEHAEDASLVAGGVMRAGATAARLGLRGWPPEAEVRIVERDVALARATGGWVHVTHLSTAAALEVVRRARADGVRVTCDVTPHHLALADDWVGGERTFAWDDPDGEPKLPGAAYDGTCRVNPPLTTREDARALLAAVADGTIDAIATDHAPHQQHRKLVPFADAAPGLIGLETALSLGLAAVAAGRLPLATLLDALSTRPARLLGEQRGLTDGTAADLVAFDPSASWVVEREALASASWNTPLLGRKLPGVVRLTVANGRVTYRS
jgi:dihydroorotase